MHRTNHTMTLSQAREATPSIDGPEAWRRSLQAAVFNGVSEGDVTQIVGKLKEKALAGDLKAINLLLTYIVGSPGGHSRNVNALQVSIEPQPPLPAPTRAPVGSEEKILLMQHRVENGESVFSPEDESEHAQPATEPRTPAGNGSRTFRQPARIGKVSNGA